MTWRELSGSAERALLICNSGAEDRAALDRVVAALASVVSSEGLSVICPSAWREYFLCKGILPHRIMPTRAGNQELEVNTFLESAVAFDWVERQEPQVIMGSLAHNLYNEEVKDIFEQRICWLLGDSVFLAHSLPNDYVYVLRLPDLCRRLGRETKRARYCEVSRAILDDFYKLWLERSRPVVEDERDFQAEREILARHLGRAVLCYDEASRVPIEPPDTLADIVGFWSETVAQRNATLASIESRKSFPLVRRVWRLEDGLRKVVRKVLS